MAKLAKCEGQLVKKESGGMVNEYFETEFVLSDEVKDVHQARSIIQAGLLHERLIKDVPQYKNWRECQVVSLESTNAKAETGEFEQLLLKCSEAGCVPENLSSYSSDASKIKALTKAIERNNARIAAAEQKEKAENILKMAGA